MNILIRADSSSNIGTGHIMRDLVLASKIKDGSFLKKIKSIKIPLDNQIFFATQNLDGNINFKIEQANYKIEPLLSNDFEELDRLIKKLNIDLLIIDHYGIDFNFEKKLKEENPALKIFVFDDTYEKHFCDVLLNHNISGDEKRYKGLVTNHCELLCGAKYTLLRDEFRIAKKDKNKKQKKSKNKLVFIAMGGADHTNINPKILKVIKKLRKDKRINIKVNLVTTFANRYLNDLKEYCKNKKWINLHINSNQIAKLMIESDFAIVTPSVTVNEVCYLKLPLIAIKTAENQIDMYDYLKKKNKKPLSSFDEKKLKKSIIEILGEIDGNYKV